MALATANLWGSMMRACEDPPYLSLAQREAHEDSIRRRHHRPVPTRRDVANPLELAAAHSLIAHRALGRMSACQTVAEFSEAAADLMNAAREMSQSFASLAHVPAGSDGNSSERRRAFSAWFATQVTTVFSHPMQSELQRTGMPTVYLSRLARGSGPPPIREAMTLARMMSVPPRPDDFFFEGADKRPAIEMCAEYLERVTSLLEQSKQAMKRFGLE